MNLFSIKELGQTPHNDAPGRFILPYQLVGIFLVMVVGICVGGYLYYYYEKSYITKEVEQTLTTIADLKVRQIANWRKERLGDGAVIHQNPVMVRHMQQFLYNPQLSEFRKDILQWLRAFREGYNYESIILLDKERAIRLAISEKKEVLGPDARRLAAEAMATKKVVLSDLYISVVTKKPRLSLLVPLVVQQGKASVSVGVVLLRIDPYQFIFPLIELWPAPSSTAETLLLRREGDTVVHLNELRHRTGPALSLRLPAADRNQPTTRAIQGYEGIANGFDYRGVKVVAAVRRVPDSPWFLVAKIDEEEAYEDMRKYYWYIVLFMAALIAGLGAGLGFIRRHQQAQLYHQQYKAEIEKLALAKHYESLTKYANDGILLLDEKGDIVEANERTESFYGYTRDELLRLNIRELRVPELRSLVEKQMKQVAARDGLVFETVQQRKDGTTFPVEISSRVIAIEGKNFFQSNIRDITVRKQLELVREKLVLDLQGALAKVEQLSGLLPICASCKKIRDEKGGWNQIEMYIREHSRAEFTHSICPECAKRLYPEFYKER
jgi:PAS domain S-box-containing protein